MIEPRPVRLVDELEETMRFYVGDNDILRKRGIQMAVYEDAWFEGFPGWSTPHDAPNVAEISIYHSWLHIRIRDTTTVDDVLVLFAWSKMRSDILTVHLVFRRETDMERFEAALLKRLEGV